VGEKALSGQNPDPGARPASEQARVIIKHNIKQPDKV
jgi:hypothetical protein